MAHHLDNRRVNRRMIAQEIGASIVGGEHDRIAIRQVIIQHREALTAPARPRAKPGRDNRSRLLLRQIRHVSKHYRQRHRTVIPRIKKRHREVGQIVIHRQHVIGQIQGAISPDV